jgi:transcriptional regulator with XRE-family HTH domain
MTKLHTYLTAAGKKQSDLARELGVSRGYLSELVNGAKKPGLALATDIERATAGAVPASDWHAPQTGDAA